MLEKIIDYIGKIGLLIIFLGMIILTCYGVVALGFILLKWIRTVV